MDNRGRLAIRWVAIAGCGIWLAVMGRGDLSVAAEGTSIAPAPAPSGAPIPSVLTFETRVLPLTRQDAAYLALLNSRDVKIERLGSDILKTAIRTERGVFDPTFSM